MPHLHRIAGIVIVCSVLLGIFASSGSVRKNVKTARAGSAAASPAVTATAGAGGRPSASPGGGRARSHGSERIAAATVSPAPAAPAAAAAKANELGQVPVLMYHRIVARTQSPLDRTPGQLKAELVRLAREGYVPVTATEFVDGRLDIPAGRHPVVLTFDDGTPGQFALDEQGRPRPGTAVAVLLEVAAAHPGFRPVATFYVNREPFALGDRAADGLAWLIRQGFEIGNHTLTHPDLSRLSKAAVQKEIDEDERQILRLTGSPTTTLAYPYGSSPARTSWAESSTGRYRFRGIFLAGWRPSSSPFAKSFDPLRIPRIRSAGKIPGNDCRLYCSTAWLDWLEAGPGRRYTSDGDPRVITFPADVTSALAPDHGDRARSYPR